MIIIIRTLSHEKILKKLRPKKPPKKERSQTSQLKKRKKEKKEIGQRRLNKKGGPKRPAKKEKKKRGNVTILLPHLCFRVAPCSSYRDSPMLSLSYTSGNFHYRTWLVYSNDGLPQMPKVFMSKQVGCTPT